MRLTLLLLMLLIGTPPLLMAEDTPLKMYTIVPGSDIVLQDEYGILLVNDGSEEEPIPRYILAIQNSRTILDTRDLGLFQIALKQIPKGHSIFRYDSCTITRSSGLTNKQKEEFEQSVIDVGLKIQTDKDRITCYCKTSDQ